MKKTNIFLGLAGAGVVAYLFFKNKNKVTTPQALKVTPPVLGDANIPANVSTKVAPSSSGIVQSEQPVAPVTPPVLGDAAPIPTNVPTLDAMPNGVGIVQSEQPLASPVTPVQTQVGSGIVQTEQPIVSPITQEVQTTSDLIAQQKAIDNAQKAADLAPKAKVEVPTDVMEAQVQTKLDLCPDGTYQSDCVGHQLGLGSGGNVQTGGGFAIVDYAPGGGNGYIQPIDYAPVDYAPGGVNVTPIDYAPGGGSVTPVDYAPGGNNVYVQPIDYAPVDYAPGGDGLILAPPQDLHPVDMLSMLCPDGTYQSDCTGHDALIPILPPPPPPEELHPVDLFMYGNIKPCYSFSLTNVANGTVGVAYTDCCNGEVINFTLEPGETRNNIHYDYIDYSTDLLMVSNLINYDCSNGSPMEIPIQIATPISTISDRQQNINNMFFTTDINGIIQNPYSGSNGSRFDDYVIDFGITQDEIEEAKKAYPNAILTKLNYLVPKLPILPVKSITPRQQNINNMFSTTDFNGIIQNPYSRSNGTRFDDYVYKYNITQEEIEEAKKAFPDAPLTILNYQETYY